CGVVTSSCQFSRKCPTRSALASKRLSVTIPFSTNSISVSTSTGLCGATPYRVPPRLRWVRAWRYVWSVGFIIHQNQDFLSIHTYHHKKPHYVCGPRHRRVAQQ